MNFQSKSDLLNYLEQSYEKIGAFDAEIIYIYSDFRFFGQYMPFFQSKNEFCSFFIEPFLSRGKTVVIATFSYTSEGVFDVHSTPTTLGVLNKWFLAQPGVSRSEHPIFSYSALGTQKTIVEKVGKSAFGKNSIFEKLMGKKTAFLHVGRPVELGNTALHYVEHVCGATYRYSKCFKTKVVRSGEYVGTDYSSYVRKLNVPGESFHFNFEKATNLMRARGLIVEVGQKSDLSNISFYWYDDTIKFLVEQFYENQCLFINSNYKNYE